MKLYRAGDIALDALLAIVAAPIILILLIGIRVSDWRRDQVIKHKFAGNEEAYERARYRDE